MLKINKDGLKNGELAVIGQLDANTWMMHVMIMQIMSINYFVCALWPEVMQGDIYELKTKYV